MIKINLLPFRAARTKENIRRQVSIFFLSLVLVTSVLIYHNINLSNQVKKLEKDIEEIKVEVASYEKKAKRVDQIKAKLALLKQKNDVIESLQMNRYEPVSILDSMTKVIVPDRMWFTELTQLEGPKPNATDPKASNSSPSSIIIKGIALDNKTIADFMTGLETLPNFSNVRLINIEHEEIREIKMKKFEITCTKEPLKPELKDKADHNAKI